MGRMKKTGRPRKDRSMVSAEMGPWGRPKVQRVAPPGPEVEDVANYWREHLPKPPAGTQDDEQICLWVDAVAWAGGIKAISWLSAAESWPRSLGLAARSRNSGYVSRRYEELNSAAQQEQLARTRDQLDRAEMERRRAQQEQGW